MATRTTKLEKALVELILLADGETIQYPTLEQALAAQEIIRAAKKLLTRKYRKN